MRGVTLIYYITLKATMAFCAALERSIISFGPNWKMMSRSAYGNVENRPQYLIQPSC